jgi:hypothetical protein
LLWDFEEDTAPPAALNAEITIPHDQKSRCFLCPALRNIGAPGALAYGMQLVFVKKPLDIKKIRIVGNPDFKPIRLFRDKKERRSLARLSFLI